METMGSLDADILRFLDSLEEYLTRFDSLSSTLQQGWLDLASARHSMGTSRMTSAVLDLKPHPASSTVRVKLENESMLDETAEQRDDIPPMPSYPSFSLSKWDSVDDRERSPSQLEAEEDMHHKSASSLLRHRSPSHISEDRQTKQAAIHEVSVSPNDQVRKQRSKLLSVYGVLISPKLRGAQLSFETALDSVVQLANARSRMLAAFERIQRDVDVDLK